MRRTLAALCLASLPAVASATDWSLEAGAAVASAPDHLGAKSRRWLALPILSATYGDRLQASIDDGLRWTAVGAGPLKLGPVIEYRTSYDSSLPRGFPQIRDTIELGLFAELTTPIAVIEARARKAVNGYRGWSGDIAVDTLLPIRMPGTIGLEARAMWAGRAFGRSRFGMDQSVAVENGLAPYAAEDYRSVEVGGQWRLPVAPRIAFTASIAADRLLTNRNSPIVQTRSVVEAGLGLTYRLR